MTTWRVLTWNILGAHRPNLDVIGRGDLGLLTRCRRAAGGSPPPGARVRTSPRLAGSCGPASTTRTRRSCGGAPRVWRLLTPHSDRRADQRLDLARRVDVDASSHRVAMAVTVSRTGETLRVANTHLASHDADERIAQARRAWSR